ncbi:MAG: DNA cytosine methyltransferase [Candidatus Diapherotrites archaeon]|jgi:DNA (cytosine-5)-methyltransferase 1|uniref:DNA (cytosine-5-)-methyltransferase n=1 Tax=Candidatus Iainarchaeum sp. TaxID=3101447 RepID=A0A7K4BYS6_9ARCH|nr:DNA cytosine methyltransferase [Candidatus Diapherotrites archaeon]
MTKLNCVDLFAGAGGLSEGFKQAGFNTIAANEIENDFSKTFKLNHPEAKVFTEDIRNISVKDFQKQCGINGIEVDVLIGGPPCQGFSMAGRRDPKDPRNSLFMEYIRFVKELKPKYFVMENVPGILTMKNSKGKLVHEIIESEFRKIGYQVKHKKLLSADYGVPQKRRRVVFIGTRTKKPISFPKQTHTEKPELKINGFQTQSWLGVETILLDKTDVPESYFHSKKMINGFKKRKEMNKKKGNGFGWQILDPKKPSYTISARYWKDGSDALVKYTETQIRMLTEKEVARIQTFPDDYQFYGSKRSVYTQIGNAVPVLMAKAIAEEIKKYLV